MKNHTLPQSQKRPQRLTRAEWRAVAREEGRQHPAKRSRGLIRSVPATTLIGGIVTILAVVAAIVYGVTRSNASSSTSGGLTDPRSWSPASSLLSAGQRAPDFTLRDTNGKAYHLAAQRGHPVLLEFFAVWCPVCQGEAPTMAALTRDYVPKGVRVWSVLANPYGRNFETSGRSDLSLATAVDLSWYGAKFDVQFPQLIDPKFGVVNKYGINAYPGVYIVNSKGVITFAGAGHQGSAKLSRALDKALGGMKMSTRP